MVAVGFLFKASGISFKAGSHYVAVLELEIFLLQSLESCECRCAHYSSLAETATFFKAKSIPPLKTKCLSLTLCYSYCLSNISVQVSNEGLTLNMIEVEILFELTQHP